MSASAGFPSVITYSINRPGGAMVATPEKGSNHHREKPEPTQRWFDWSVADRDVRSLVARLEEEKAKVYRLTLALSDHEKRLAAIEKRPTSIIVSDLPRLSSPSARPLLAAGSLSKFS